MRNKVKIALSIIAIVGFIGGMFVITSDYLSAQDATNFQRQLSGRQITQQTPSEEIDIRKVVFANDKKGCAQKASFFSAAAIQYEKGRKTSQFTRHKIAQPIFDAAYKTIKSKGLEKARIDNMKAYNKCMGVSKHKDPETEKKQAQRFAPCNNLNVMMIDTLKSIENRQKLETVIQRHRTGLNIEGFPLVAGNFESQKKKKVAPTASFSNKISGKVLDMSGTPYHGFKNPERTFVSRIYDAKNRGGMKNAVTLASSITVGCLN